MPAIYKTQTIEEEVLDNILCDKCGKSCRDGMDMNFEFAQFIARWGYGSRKDEEEWNYFLCEDCADKVMDFIKGEYACNYSE